MHRRSTISQLAIVALVAFMVLVPVNNAGASTRKPTHAGLLGWSIGHSRSLAALATTPLPASPVAGSLSATKLDDVYDITLNRGDRLTVSAQSTPGSDIDLFVLWPEAQATDPPFAESAITQLNPEVLQFDAPVSGTYHLDVYLASADPADYTLTYSVTKAVGQGHYVRLYDSNRYTTALAISRGTFPNGSAKNVVLAGGARYPDALAASALAGSLGCPLMLTAANSLSGGVAEEIGRIGATNAYIVGGPMSVSENVAGQLRAMGLTVDRFAGRDRYEVSYGVAKAVTQLNPRYGSRVVLASGEVFPDALSASPYAYRMGIPILLTRASALHPMADAAIRELGVREVYIVGGPRSVAPGIESGIAARGISVVRLSGRDRYETAASTARYAIQRHWANPAYLSIASGQDFPDALTGGAATGAKGGVMVLTTVRALGSQAAVFAAENASAGLVDEARIFGGPASVSPAAEASFKALVAK